MKVFNIATGPVAHTIAQERQYELRFIRQGITFVVHIENGQLVLSEWTTGHRLMTFVHLDPDEVFGLDIMAEAEADSLIEKHGLEKIHHFISIREVINP